ncbi:ATP synthase F1 subunit gamma [Candidatus Auribacterota bacterium]
MATLQEVKKRIESIKKTKKITNAMQMVAGAKLYKATEKLTHAREMFEEFYCVINATDFSLFPNENILWQGKKQVNNIGLIVLSSDRGLCGSFNTFILKKLNDFLVSKKNAQLIMIGKKGLSFCHKNNLTVLQEQNDFLNQITFEKATSFFNEMKNFYLNNKIDELYILYNKFFSVIKQKPVIKRILPVFPLETFHTNKSKEKPLEYILEPSASIIIDRLIETYGRTLIYKAFCESVVSEEGSRMNAMKAATDNAEDMIDYLTLSYNRVRQAEITKQIVEIISAAEAL